MLSKFLSFSAPILSRDFTWASSSLLSDSMSDGTSSCIVKLFILFRIIIPLRSSKIPPKLGIANCCQLCNVKEPSKGLTILNLSGNFHPAPYAKSKIWYLIQGIMFNKLNKQNIWKWIINSQILVPKWKE